MIVMFSKKLQDFFIPIFSKHKKIFALLLLDGIVSGLFSVILPILLKLETDQLMAKNGFISSFAILDGFSIFIFILLVILIAHTTSRVVSGITNIVLDAEKDYLRNTIQLELFKHMNVMEV